ncbi:MAG: hypothetical protein WCI11_04750 [Candidatus Methylumidiphilus sp.]
MNAINRKPIDDKASEVTYTVYVICNRQHQKEAREQLESLLEDANYPIGNFDVHPFMQNEVQMFARLLSTSIDSKDLDRITEQLITAETVSQSFWSPSTTE